MDIFHRTKEALPCCESWSGAALQHSCFTSPAPLWLQTKRHTLLELGKCVFSWVQRDEAAVLGLFPPHTGRHIGSICKQSKSTVMQVFWCVFFFVYLLSSDSHTSAKVHVWFIAQAKARQSDVWTHGNRGIGRLIWIQGCSAGTEQFKPFVLVRFVVSLSLFRF